MRALITGAAGQLGTDLRLALDAAGDHPSSLSRADLDISDPAAVQTAIARHRPDFVFNCAAFHNVEECERKAAQAAAVNVEAVRALAKAADRARARLVHFSTNYVFDGTAFEPYSESDLPNPRSVYAITKLAGEYAALAYCPGALVIRTAGLYGLAGSASKGGNFVERMVARARGNEPIRMVADQRLAPTFTQDLAGGILEAVAAGAAGVMHMTNGGACSWHEFTEAILALAGVDAAVEPVQTTIPEGGADRPLNGVLAGDAAVAAGISPLRPWRDALADYMTKAR